MSEQENFGFSDESVETGSKSLLIETGRERIERVCPRCGSTEDKIEKGVCKGRRPDNGKLCFMRW